MHIAQPTHKGKEQHRSILFKRSLVDRACESEQERQSRELRELIDKPLAKVKSPSSKFVKTMDELT